MSSTWIEKKHVPKTNKSIVTVTTEKVQPNGSVVIKEKSHIEKDKKEKKIKNKAKKNNTNKMNMSSVLTKSIVEDSNRKNKSILGKAIVKTWA